MFKTSFKVDPNNILAPQNHSNKCLLGQMLRLQSLSEAERMKCLLKGIK